MSLPTGFPEVTLGWGVLKWCSTYLAQPDGDDKGQKWKFSNEQAMFILWFYSVDKYSGRFNYRRAVLERPKGWGKSPLLAAICCAELLGPVKFDHFDENVLGGAVGRSQPSAFVQIAAISEDQTDNTMSLVGEMLTDGGAADYYNLDIGLSRVLAPGKRKLTRVTASPRSREGNRPTFVVMDETHLWIPVENGPELANVLRRNLAKTSGRSIETTNAPVPGQGSVAEMSHDYYESILAGTAFDNMLLFDSREVIIENIYDKEQAYPALVQVYGDAAAEQTGWIDLDRVWAEINDPATKEYDARRYYFNQRVQEYSQWIKDHQWAKVKDESLKLKKTDLIALGFKLIPRQGAAALVGCREKDGALFLLGLWERPVDAGPDWEVPVKSVDARVRKWLAKDNVRYLMADPWNVPDVVGRWSVDFPDMVEEFWMNQHLKVSKAVNQFEEAIYDSRIIHNGDFNLTRHVMNCHTEEVTAGYILRKDRSHSTRYIDAAQAAVIAYEALMTAREKGLMDALPDRRIFGY